MNTTLTPSLPTIITVCQAAQTLLDRELSDNPIFDKNRDDAALKALRTAKAQMRYTSHTEQRHIEFSPLRNAILINA